MTSELIPPARPYFPRADIEDLKGHLDKILSSGALTLGEYTKEFERETIVRCTLHKNVTGLHSAYLEISNL